METSSKFGELNRGVGVRFNKSKRTSMKKMKVKMPKMSFGKIKTVSKLPKFPKAARTTKGSNRGKKAYMTYA